MSIAELLPTVAVPEVTDVGTGLGLGGLRAADGRVFPLRSVKVRASIAGPCARTTVEQHFANPFDEALDVTWIFPLPADGAIVELELRAGDVVIQGECQERSQARATFDAAAAQGKRTALVEKELGDVHTLSLADIPPRKAVTVRLTLVQLLPANDGNFRWQFPTTIAPRYTPGHEIGHEGPGVAADTDVVPNASRLGPPLRLKGGTELDLEVEIAGPLRSVASSLHSVKFVVASGAVRIAPSARATLNKDFILEFSTADSDSTSTRAWTDGTHTLVLLEPPATADVTGLPRDAVFAVDISGSMAGSKLDAAKVALRGALHGLRNGDRFKLIAFDDRLERFTPDFSIYNDQNLKSADRWIDALDARGGTEMLPAIQESLEGTTSAGRLRTVLLITDGQSNDEARLLPAIANRRGDTLFFTLGIDTAVNAALLKTLARAGGGVCELCTPSDDVDAVVARLEVRFGSPLLSQLKVAGAARPDGQTVFAGRPASILLDNSPAAVEVAGIGPTGPFQASVTPTRVSFPLGALWAMERVAWLEERLSLRPFEEEAIRPEILRIALQWHISSKFTSFVCVDHSSVSTGDRRHIVQPAELAESWADTDEMRFC
ncbi:MAG: VIT and VWA domain-containing protein, partial [Gemmatimonadota bacterium]|nr:VIT and VWA domain-containing protein [Gemmatimonadota bacterium]